MALKRITTTDLVLNAVSAEIMDIGSLMVNPVCQYQQILFTGLAGRVWLVLLLNVLR